jgi:hypothetical protein
MLYNVSRARRKSGEKHKKAIEWFILILKKEAQNGETKWTQKTKKVAQERINKMGISKAQIVAALERKGLKDLLSKVN